MSIQIFRTWKMEQFSIIWKISLTGAYLLFFVCQTVFDVSAVFMGHHHIILSIISALLLTVPFIFERFIISIKNNSFYLPSVEEATTFAFEELAKNQKKIQDSLNGMKKISSVFSKDNLNDLISDLPRHSSIHYINNGSLSEEYFKKASESLSDPYLYIVISNTGSPASELIALFTQKQFNHASLSFDYNLSTIISYNGGERVYAPGLNPEMIESFHKKDDASVLVYRIKVTLKKKKSVLDTIEQINETGSAYNILGLVTKSSFKQNIMFCSQFVYKMLQIADAVYFEKAPGNVQPTDFIELDYHRQLEYVSEIKF